MLKLARVQYASAIPAHTVICGSSGCSSIWITEAPDLCAVATVGDAGEYNTTFKCFTVELVPSFLCWRVLKDWLECFTVDRTR